MSRRENEGTRFRGEDPNASAGGGKGRGCKNNREALFQADNLENKSNPKIPKILNKTQNPKSKMEA